MSVMGKSDGNEEDGFGQRAKRRNENKTKHKDVKKKNEPKDDQFRSDPEDD